MLLNFKIKNTFRRLFVVLIFISTFLCLPQTGTSQVDTIRVATYNILNFPSAFGNERIPYLRKVITAISPDILVVQELESAAGQQRILSEILNYQSTGVYDAAPFTGGPDTDNGLFYNKERIVFGSGRQIPTDVRNITEYILSSNNIRFLVYSAHLKASSGEQNENKRLVEAKTLRSRLNILPENTNFIAVGDFNFYSASEPGFVALTEQQAANHGNLIDPINRLGYWHSNSQFRKIHTQSTRSSDKGDGGSGGGLDDRFDLILVSSSIMVAGGMQIIPDSYRAFGNDSFHFNLAINYGINYTVPDSIADALYESSDHLPVYADFVVGTTSAVAASDVLPSRFDISQNYPNPFNSETSFSIKLSKASEVEIFIYDLQGHLITTLRGSYSQPGSYFLNWNGKNSEGRNVSSGIYLFTSGKKGVKKTGKMLLVR